MYLYDIKHMILEQNNFLFFFLYSNEREHLYPRNANRDVHMISSTKHKLGLAPDKAATLNFNAAKGNR